MTMMTDIKQKYWVNGQWVDVDVENANNLDWFDSTDFASRITEKRLDHAGTHYLLANNDWSKLAYNLENPEGELVNVSYKENYKCVAMVFEQKLGVKLRMPIDEKAYYTIRIRANAVNGTTRFSAGVVTLGNDYQPKIYNNQVFYSLGAANNQAIMPGTEMTFTGTFHGYNLVSERNHNKFSADGNYFDLVLMNEGEMTLIYSIEVIKSPDELFVQNNRVWHEGNFNPDLKADVTYVEDEMTYTNDVPIVTAIGDIAVGDTFDNVHLHEMLTRILYPYVAPLISLSASVGASTREYGVPINSVNFTANITKKSRPPQAVKFYKDSALVHTVSSPKPNGGSEAYACTTPISNTCTFTAKVEDGKSVVTSGGIKYTFVYPIYVGDTDMAAPIETVIKSFEKRVVTKANQDKTYTVVNKRFCIAYPVAYGNLKSILDANQFEVINDFEKRIVEMTMADGTKQSYNVYTFKNLVEVSNFKISYRF